MEHIQAFKELRGFLYDDTIIQLLGFAPMITAFDIAGFRQANAIKSYIKTLNPEDSYLMLQGKIQYSRGPQNL